MVQCNGIVAGRVIGIDLGDQESRYCVLNPDREVEKEGRVGMTRGAFRKAFTGEECRVIVEAGSQSAWVSEELESLGHEVIVANPRRVRLIHGDVHKDDGLDAEKLARLGAYDVKLLSPISHRGAECRADLAVIRSREVLVKLRTTLVNHVRSAVKQVGARLPSCATEAFARKAAPELPDELRPALTPILESLHDLNRRIREYDRDLEKMAEERYPETQLLRQVSGVGSLTSLAFLLTLESARRFPKSRTVGAYIGLTPRRSQSGSHDPELRITKAGNGHLRKLLVSSAHYILGFRGPDCDLRQFGQRIEERGGKRAKKRAVVAVARKLAVLLHHLWKTGEVYDPFHTANRKEAS